MLLRNFVGVQLLRLLSVGLNLLLILLVTLWVSPAEYGRYSLVLSVAQILGAALLSWPNQATLRYGREDFITQGSFGGVFGARMAMQLAVLLIILPAIYLTSDPLSAWLDVDCVSLVVLLSLVLMFYPASELANVGAQIVSRYLGFGFAPVIQRLSLLAVVCLYGFGVTLTWEVLMMGNVFGYLLAVVIIGAMIPFPALSPLRVEFAQVRRILAYSWAMPLASLSAFAMSQMDLWFLKYFMPMETVGVYAWAYNVSLLATGLLVPLSVVLAPRAIDLHIGNRIKELANILRFSHGLLAFAAALMPAINGLLFVAVTALPLGVYASAKVPLLVLAAGTVFQLGMALMEPIVFSQKHLVSRTVLLFILMAFLNALLDLWLIPLLGLLGPAIATAGAFAVGMLLEWRMLGQCYADGKPRCVRLMILWTATPLLLLWPMLKLTGFQAILFALISSLLMLAVGRRLGLFSGLGLLSLHLRPALRPLLAWVAGK